MTAAQEMIEMGLSAEEAREAIAEGWTPREIEQELMAQADEAMGPGIRAEMAEVESYRGPLIAAQEEAGYFSRGEFA